MQWQVQPWVFFNCCTSWLSSHYIFKFSTKNPQSYLYSRSEKGCNFSHIRIRSMQHVFCCIQYTTHRPLSKVYLASTWLDLQDCLHSSGRLWHWNDAQLVLRGPQFAMKILPSHQQQQPEAFAPTMLSCCLHQILTPPSERPSRSRVSSDQATFLKSSTVQFWWACMNCSPIFLFFLDMNGNQCGLLLL